LAGLRGSQGEVLGENPMEFMAVVDFIQMKGTVVQTILK